MAENSPSLTPEQLRRIDELCAKAMDHPKAQWESVVQAACPDDPVVAAEVLSLLERISPVGTAMTGGLPGGVRTAKPMPERIGPYRILGVLGEGGFGVVYEAEQSEPMRRRVALKLIKPGMDSKAVISRFEAERQALALMGHPCVARVYDGGVTEQGRPYFAMELVRGEPINTHCDRQRLSIRDRLELFIRVCEAVQHAHSKGIIHRDLKPSNILVEYENGVSTPKVIDFGVAKALNQRLTEATVYTQQGQMIGTPEYMSPEQAEMGATDIDTRSDVYSLGVVLYEILVGATPFDPKTLRAAGYAEIQRILREVEPPRPSTRLKTLLDTPDDPEAAARIVSARRADARGLSQALRRDLDWVLIKCLEKNRERRYDTATALSADLRRFLNDEPVIAGPPSASYRFSKFVKRNRGAVFAGTAVAVALLAGIAGTSTGMIWALGERDRADQRALELDQVARFQEQLLSSLKPMVLGERLWLHTADRYRGSLTVRGLTESEIESRVEELRVTLRDVNFTDLARGVLDQAVVQRATDSIETQFADLPLVRARLYQSIARTARAIGEHESAVEPQRLALKIRRDELGPESPLTLRSMIESAGLMLETGQPESAEPLALEAARTSARLLGAENELSLESEILLGDLRAKQARWDEAETHYRDVLATQRTSLGAAHPATRSTMNRLGLALRRLNRPDEAETLYREIRDAPGLFDDAQMNATNNLAVLLIARGRTAEAEPIMREAVERRRLELGDDHPETVVSVGNLGRILRSLGRLSQAEPLLAEALLRRTRAYGDSSPLTARLLSEMGLLRDWQGQPEQAKEFYNRALPGLESDQTSEPLPYALCLNNLGFLHQRQGEFYLAAPPLREALAQLRDCAGATSLYTIGTMGNLGFTLGQLGEHDEAHALGLESIELAIAHLTTNHGMYGANVQKHAATLQAMGRFAESEPGALEAHGFFLSHSSFGPRHPKARGAVEQLVSLYQSWDIAEPGSGHAASAQRWQAELEP